MASKIDPNLLLVVGAIGVGGYFLWNSGVLKSVGNATENLSNTPNTAIKETSKNLSNITDKTSDIIIKAEDIIGDTIKNVTTIPNKIIDTTGNIFNNITDTISNSVDKLTNLGGNQGVTPSFITFDKNDPKNSSPAGNITPLGQKFLDSIPALNSTPISQVITTPASSGGGSSGGSSGNSARYKFLEGTNTFKNSLGGYYSPFQKG